MTRLKGIFLTPVGFRCGQLTIDQGIITSLEGDPISENSARNLGMPIHVPGFIDLHVHGGCGSDFMDGGDATAVIAACHARHGTTALLSTTMTAPKEEIERALQGIAPHTKKRQKGTARVLGVHLEGPYINAERLGAQPNYVANATLAAIEAFHSIAPIRILTMAPEIQENLKLIPQLAGLGIRVQIGHSSATYEDGCKAIACGAHGFTHLFNAISGLHHRQPGLVGAALAHANHAEVIPDLLHVHPGAIRAALRAIPELFCVTDSTSATDMPDGNYHLGRQQVIKCMGGVRLADGTIAGSILTMDQAVRNLVIIGLSLRDACRRASEIPADYLGLAERGRLQPGAVADIATFDGDLNLTQVFVEGEEIVLADA